MPAIMQNSSSNERTQFLNGPTERAGSLPPADMNRAQQDGSDCYAEALHRFRTLLDRAREIALPEPMAMTLATVDAGGTPSARTVLLKDVDERGVMFYTSLMSRKAQQLTANSRAALCFFWQPLMTQVLIEGDVEQVSDDAADAYWATRPRPTQLGAWASRQSRRLARRRLLDGRVVRYTLRYAGRPVPRPWYWSGFRVMPTRIEFWRRGAFRLHERVLYERTNGEWTVHRLYP